jgi:hypothetical protein
MSPKEKAKEIYWKYYQLVADGSHPELNSKKCALIAVNEILEEALGLDDNDYQLKSDYWLEVKQEIEKL